MTAYVRAFSDADIPALHGAESLWDVFDGPGPTGALLEQSWDGLNRLSSSAGDDPTPGFWLTERVPVGPGLGYSPARLFDATYVGRLDAALRAVTDEPLWAGFDAARFEADGVYPGIRDEPDDESRNEYLSYTSTTCATLSAGSPRTGDVDRGNPVVRRHWLTRR